MSRKFNKHENKLDLENVKYDEKCCVPITNKKETRNIFAFLYTISSNINQNY